MKALRDLTIEDIDAMDYNNLRALVRETNRIPGGYKTIASIVTNAFLKPEHRILEIGTSTGVTSIEIAKAVGCSIEAIDINERSLQEAASRARLEGVGDLIDFRLADAQNLDCKSESFDMVTCGNVTSLIPDRKKALDEYVRVLKPNGVLAAVPMYYLEQPTDELLSRVCRAIQTDVQVVERDWWVDFYNQSGLTLKYVENYRFDRIADKTLDEFIQFILNRDFLQELRSDAFEFLSKKYRDYIYLFRDNLSHMGYSILLYKKEPVNNEPELFRGTLLSSWDAR